VSVVLRRILFAIVGLVVVAFVAIQLIPVNRTNSPITTPIKWDSPQTEALARRACMDCHSNETTWTWYSYVAPASWLIYYDVQQGRSRFNISALAAGTAPNGPNQFAPTNDLAYQLGQLMSGGQRDGGGEGRFPGGENFPPQGNRPQGNFQPPNGNPPNGGRFGNVRLPEFAQQIQSGQMPPANYLMIHQDANLSVAEKQQLIQGLTATFGQGNNR
jgi:hypothetical protein